MDRAPATTASRGGEVIGAVNRTGACGGRFPERPLEPSRQRSPEPLDLARSSLSLSKGAKSKGVSLQNALQAKGISR